MIRPITLLIFIAFFWIIRYATLRQACHFLLVVQCCSPVTMTQAPPHISALICSRFHGRRGSCAFALGRTTCGKNRLSVLRMEIWLPLSKMHKLILRQSLVEITSVCVLVVENDLTYLYTATKPFFSVTLPKARNTVVMLRGQRQAPLQLPRARSGYVLKCNDYNPAAPPPPRRPNASHLYTFNRSFIIPFFPYNLLRYHIPHFHVAASVFRLFIGSPFAEWDFRLTSIAHYSLTVITATIYLPPRRLHINAEFFLIQAILYHISGFSGGCILSVART